MGIGNTFEKWKRSYHKRYASDGYMKILEKKLPLFKKIAQDMSLKEKKSACWWQAYLGYLEAKLKYLKTTRLLPSDLAKKLNLEPQWQKYISGCIDACFEENYVFLNGVKLPKPQNKVDYEVFLIIVFDVFLQHLMNFDLDMIKNVDYDFYRGCPEGPYEYDEVYLQPGDVVIDAGACIGDFSALAAYKGCTAYAFEPSQTMIDRYLNKTAELNQGIIIAPYALHSEKATFEFMVPEANMGGSFLANEETLTQESKNAEIKLTEVVKAIDLDSYVEENKLAKVDFLKADIEGAERNMLKGAQNILKEFAPKLALCTYHLPDDPQVMEELILQANPKYVIKQQFAKLYAYVPK